MKGKNVLIVDDNHAIIDSISLFLDFEGYDVTPVTKGSDVFKTVHEKMPDIILLDMWLSGEDGRDICRQLKSAPQTQQIPVIMMSASRGLEDSTIAAGADAFISKPFDMDVMLAKISELI